MSSYKILLLIFLIPFTFSSLCYNSQFNSISENRENSFEIGPSKEYCSKYTLLPITKKLILVFPKIISNTAEVLLYKSQSDIPTKGEYTKYLDRFLINENSFKEVDLADYDKEIYIIIRDSKYNEAYKSYFILYDTEVPITLTEGKPLTIKYFVKNNEYKFKYSSNKNLTFVYSTKVKSKKNICIKYNGEFILQKQIDETDYIFNLKSENTLQKDLYVTVEDIEEGTEDQEFSVIVYEKNITQFFEIKKSNIYTTNYLSLNKDEEKQIFFFYYNLGSFTKINTINFKLDPEAKNTNYINIQSGVYHSMKDIPDDEKDIHFRFNENKFPIEYDINSDEYLKLYFQDSDTSFTYRYIYFKVEISKTNYYSPKNFAISIGDGIEEKFYKTIDYYKAQTISIYLKADIASYIKLVLDPKEKYLLSSPLPNKTIFTKGAIITKDEYQNIMINRAQFTDPDEIIVLSGISELTLSLISSSNSYSYFYLEKYNEKDVHIIENYRNYEPFELTYDEKECEDNKKKYLFGIYNRQIYSQYNKTYVKYWTTNDGDFKVYYRNGVQLDQHSLFPTNSKYLQKKEYTIMLKFFIDFFTFECKKPGSLSLRSPYKIFNETTHQIGQNSFLKFKMTNKLEIIQLTAPMKPPTNYLYFGLFSKYGKQIKISADYPPLFKDTIIEGDQVFLTKIDLYKYESDQLAIKLYAEESTELEAVEIIRYNFTEYTVLKDARKKKISDNHFIRFINPNTEEIKVKVNGLKNVEILFGFVQLFTNDINYLPMANKFEDGYLRRREINKKDSMKLKNPFLKNTDSRKKYLAFIFSIPEYKYYQYEAQVIQDGEEDEDPDVNILGIVLSIVGALILIAIIGIIVYYFWKKKKGEKAGKDEFINEDNEENYKSINDGENNKNNYEENNNINNNVENNINNKKKNVIHRFDDEDDENDKRLYKSFDDE